MSRKYLGYILFFVIVVIGFFIASFWGTDRLEARSPSISYVRPFSFTTENGEKFTDRDMAGKVCLVNFFFTTCKGICPKMNHHVNEIYTEFKDYPEFLIVSHTSDPERDDVAQLKRYADSLKVNEHKWIFLTGRKDSLYNQARLSYLLDDPQNSLKNIDDEFLHTQFIALVDKNGDIRGSIYDGLKEKDLDKLKKDIKTLLQEKPGKSRFSIDMATN